MTDAEEDLAALLDACKTRGVTAMAASYLFLRPAITASLNRRIADRALLDKVLTPYVAGSRFALRGGAGGGRNLPQPIRAAGYERVARLGTERGFTIFEQQDGASRSRPRRSPGSSESQTFRYEPKIAEWLTENPGPRGAGVRHFWPVSTDLFSRGVSAGATGLS